jgi:hypothetical protein
LLLLDAKLRLGCESRGLRHHNSILILILAHEASDLRLHLNLRLQTLLVQLGQTLARDSRTRLRDSRQLGLQRRRTKGVLLLREVLWC